MLHFIVLDTNTPPPQCFLRYAFNYDIYLFTSILALGYIALLQSWTFTFLGSGPLDHQSWKSGGPAKFLVVRIYLLPNCQYFL